MLETEGAQPCDISEDRARVEAELGDDFDGNAGRLGRRDFFRERAVKFVGTDARMAVGIAGNADRADAAPALLAAGTHGISNAVLDTPWPKLVRKRAELGALLAEDPATPLEQLIDLMRDPRLARDDELPATGLSLERERALSAAFIEGSEYGTRGTTALRVVARREQISVTAAERSDDDGSHRIVRPGDFERSFAFNVER